MKKHKLPVGQLDTDDLHEEIVTISHAIRLLNSLYLPSNETRELRDALKEHYVEYLIHRAADLKE